MGKTWTISTLRVDRHFGTLAIQRISKVLQESLSREINITAMSGQVEHYFDLSTGANFVAALCAIATFILTGIDSWTKLTKHRTWTVPKISETVRDKAVCLTGSSALSNFRYVGIGDFFEGKQKWCKVIVEIDDEDYVFYIRRDRDIVGIKLED